MIEDLIGYAFAAALLGWALFLVVGVSAQVLGELYDAIFNQDKPR